MTKETYESRISQLDEADSDYSTTVSRWSAENIADDADREIKKLKELLKRAIWYIEENDPLIEEIVKAVNDE
jgi:hypothetical protein